MPRMGLDLHTILQAATELADHEGLASVTLASLAKKLNIRPPSLYNHIEGLGGLRKKLAVHGLDILYDRLAQASIGKAKDEAVHSVADAYVTFAREHRGIYELTLQAAEPEDHEIQKAGGRIVDLTVQILRGYGLENDEVIHAVRGLRSILHGFSSLEQKGGFGLPLELDKSLHLLLDSYLAGIHKMKEK
ncbi:TetR-like C-terminal domain-containing protein [Metabacillus halosaccharovorans]|uniref:TetR-like C-terminal domain-containing protein n=1 Tax=Metabacillus halosaccharovorans TaxID=930124 RepID=UPI001C1F66DB|nr:TetR-like C-terminal domain-containing protein [Metabacillus halosaccharovorans]MBU7591611.1 TetR/AcrR family transcriptional regulator [Metabacillus halosaccharovorans]